MSPTRSRWPPAPITLTIENRWNEGKTRREVTAVLKKMSDACMMIDGVYAFQYSVDEARKVNALTEVYRDAAAIGAMMAGTASIQPELFGAITTTRVVCSGPTAQIDGVRETLAKLGAEFFYTDDVCPAFTLPPKGAGAAAPIILTIENKWNDGKTKAEVAATLTKMSQACLAVDGVYMFQYAMDEASRINALTEVYADAAALGAMMAASRAAQSELFSAVTTTRVVCSGPEAAIAPVKETLAALGSEFFYTDAVCPAFAGFQLPKEAALSPAQALRLAGQAYPASAPPEKAAAAPPAPPAPLEKPEKPSDEEKASFRFGGTRARPRKKVRCRGPALRDGPAATLPPPAHRPPAPPSSTHGLRLPPPRRRLRPPSRRARPTSSHRARAPPAGPTCTSTSSSSAARAAASTCSTSASRSRSPTASTAASWSRRCKALPSSSTAAAAASRSPRGRSDCAT